MSFTVNILKSWYRGLGLAWLPIFGTREWWRLRMKCIRAALPHPFIHCDYDPDRLVKIRNYPDLKRALEIEFRDRLVEYDSKEHTLNSTIALFSSAHAVVGSHGGAFPNLIFCPIDTVVIEAMPCDSCGVLNLKHDGMMYYVYASMRPC